jgi:SAM-dependent methyltransferase
MLIISSQTEVEAMIQDGWRVLDVGSGDRPFPKATMLVDRLPGKRSSPRGELRENPTGAIVRNGIPFTEGDLEALPFEDGSFDFVNAAHVLEHVLDPAKAISELQRVAPRGYIECPRSWFEFVDGSLFHHWLIDLADGELEFRPKTKAEEEFIESRRLFDFSRAHFLQFYGHIFQGFDSGDPTRERVEKGICHLCVYWEGKIPYRIVPPHTYQDSC